MGDAETIRAVILDAGGVILHPNFDWIAAEAMHHGIAQSIDQLHLAYYRMMHVVDVALVGATGGLAVSSDEIRTFLMYHLLRDADVGQEALAAAATALARAAAARFPRESDIYHWSMPGVRQRLEALRDAGFLLGVASNNDGALAAQLDNVGLTDLFAVRLDSAIEGVAKPDPALLLRAARRLAVDPADCLYVGDIDRVDGVAARSAGMRFALLDPLAQQRPARPLCISCLDAIADLFSPVITST